MLIEQSYATLPELLYTPVEPQIVSAPKLVIANDALAAELGIERDWLHSAEALQLLVGNAVPPHGNLIAMAYAGHQFGGFNAKLGDGRAALWGDIPLAGGTRRGVDLKGSGRNVYSRGGDGVAPLAAMRVE